MELRICSCDADIRALAALATEIWHEYFTAIISKEQIDYMVEKFQSYPVLKKAIEEENYTYFLAYEEGAMIGFCGVKPEKDRLFLSKLYLHKKARGKGLSSILLKRAISFAREQDKKAIYLTCNKFNQHSLDVYRAKGFKDIDSVQTDIGQGFIMDDYILQLELDDGKQKTTLFTVMMLRKKLPINAFFSSFSHLMSILHSPL